MTKNKKENRVMKVSVIGLGYVGLPLACAIAKNQDVNLVGYDNYSNKISQIKQGICPIDDVQCELDLKTVKFEVSDKADIIANSDIYIVCVPTPILDDYSPDLTPLKDATTLLAKYVKKVKLLS